MRYGGQPVYDDNEDHADLSSFARMYICLSYFVLKILTRIIILRKYE